MQKGEMRISEIWTRVRAGERKLNRGNAGGGLQPPGVEEERKCTVEDEDGGAKLSSPEQEAVCSEGSSTAEWKGGGGEGCVVRSMAMSLGSPRHCRMLGLESSRRRRWCIRRWAVVVVASNHRRRRRWCDRGRNTAGKCSRWNSDHASASDLGS
ncbi:hypothetical protein L2E82_32491 [Cichorium intybus]|uniref:Uncharacterized protein n=1 Tax=Cichorium intybus TaxID=13427 RepID=A0ACB9BHP9_CICIN|nr:hypothetical protein L2E82_32491 [Cichorium intybus]